MHFVKFEDNEQLTDCILQYQSVYSFLTVSKTRNQTETDGDQLNDSFNKDYDFCERKSLKSIMRTYDILQLLVQTCW